MLIIHRCKTCHHPDYWATTSSYNRSAIPAGTINGRPVPEGLRRLNCAAEWGAQGCGCKVCQWGPPETAPRWSNTDGSEVKEIAKPGSPANGGQPSNTCSCDDCRALHTELTGQVVAADVN